MALRSVPLAVALSLAAAASSWAGDGATAPSGAPMQRTMAVTVDDLPATPADDLAEMRRITDGVLAALRKHQVPAIGFVNEQRLGPQAERKARVALLADWLAAACELGNHTYAHAGLQTTPLAEYEQQVLQGEQETRRLLAARGRAPRYFRHPFTQTGPTAEVKHAFEAFLAEHGYVVAPFSIETSDYVFDAVRHAALARGDADTAARLRSVYLDHSLAVTEFMESLARDTFGRPIAQILLVHANGTNAEALDELLSRLEARGYRFVSLGEALADEAWKTPDEYVGPHGPSWLHRFQIAKGRPSRLREEPDPPKWLLDAYQALQPR